MLTENIQRTSGEVRVRVWDDFSHSPPGIEAYQLTAHHHQGCQCQGGGGCQLALIGRRAILRSSPGNLYLIMQLHTPMPSFSTQYIRLFGVVVSILQQSKPTPGIHGRLTCFKQRLMKDVMPLVEVCLFLHAEHDYRSRSAFTDEQEGWDDYFIVSFFFAIKVIHSRASSRAPEPFLSTLWQCISDV